MALRPHLVQVEGQRVVKLSILWPAARHTFSFSLLARATLLWAAAVAAAAATATADGMVRLEGRGVTALTPLVGGVAGGLAALEALV